MKTLLEHRKVIIKHHRDCLVEYKDLFELRVHMISIRLCPNCGKYLNSWNSGTGHFPCSKCDFSLTELEVQKILTEYDDRISVKMRKSILNRKLRKARRKRK